MKHNINFPFLNILAYSLKRNKVDHIGPIINTLNFQDPPRRRNYLALLFLPFFANIFEPNNAAMGRGYACVLHTMVFI